MQTVTFYRLLLSQVLLLPFSTGLAQQSATPLIIPPAIAPATPEPGSTAPFTFSTVPPPVPARRPGEIPPIAIPGASPPAPVSPGALSIEDLQRLGLRANGLVRAAQSQVDAAAAGVIG